MFETGNGIYGITRMRFKAKRMPYNCIKRVQNGGSARSFGVVHL